METEYRNALTAKHSEVLNALAKDVLEGKAWVQWICEERNRHFKTNNPDHDGVCPTCETKMSVYVFR